MLPLLLSPFSFRPARVFRLSCVALCVLLLAGCGGGGGGGGSAAGSGTGAVAVFLTDAPAHGFDEILVTIEALQLLGNGAPVTIFTGQVTVDLTDLENFSDLFTYAGNVPAGTYNKIRMRVTEITLVKDGEETPVDPPANGKLDLLPKGPFTVRPGITLVIEIDMDANKSIHIHRTGHSDRYKFRPVVMVTITESRSPSKLSRVHGEIVEIFDDTSFELCSTVFMASTREQGSSDGGIGDRHRCLSVELDDETGIFDSDGDPTDPGLLAVGDEVTVVGRLHIVDDNHDGMMEGAGAGAGHSNGNGNGNGNGHSAHHESFIHDPGDQSSRDSREDEEAGANGRDDDDDPKPEPDIVLLAYVIEIGPAGTFLSLGGVIESELDVLDHFDFRIAPSQGFGSDSVTTALLQDGARLFTRRGVELDDSEIQPGTRSRIDGVFSTSSERSIYKTALLLLDVESDRVDVLRGPILTIDDVVRRLVLAIDDTTEPTEECVDVPEDAEIFFVREGGEGSTSERASFDDLFPGLLSNVYGAHERDGGCLVAETIIAFPQECRTNAECAAGHVCAREPGVCDESGECRLVLETCTDEFVPVCGCDAMTYSNSCEAHFAGTSVDTEGECAGGGPLLCGGVTGAACPDGFRCEIGVGVCDDLAAGVCVVVSEECAAVFDPVCGCGGKTYGSACLAAREGVAVDREGPCEEEGSCGGRFELECDEGELCLRDGRVCDSEEVGHCIKDPVDCPTAFKPVCSCDGVPYDNACLAARAGATVAFDGECGISTCGGSLGLACFEGEVCLLPLGKCDGASVGVCIPTPERCPSTPLQVCGCDGMTYDSGCLAAASGVNVESLGACEERPVTCGGLEATSCTDGEICFIEAGSCEPGAVGKCVKQPMECPDLEKPVCDCDGLPYKNVCEAAVMAAVVESEGACSAPAS